jgi:mono/diheme cytochrome c family protein
MTRLALVITLILLGTALTLEFKRLTMKPWPPEYFASPDMHFKYGSIGAEVNGYPYLIWRELPTVFADRIPKGFAEFGFITEPGRDLPIGISVRRYGVKRVGFNCATCHTSVLGSGNSAQILLGAPAQQLDLQAYMRFLVDASSDPRLTPTAVFESAKRNEHPIGFFDRLVIRYVVFPKLVAQIRRTKTSMAWMGNRPPHGPGRTDAGNFWRERWGLNPQADNVIGTVDFPSVWNQRSRIHGSFHWDGNNSSLDERNISAALAGGAAEWLLDRNSIGRVSNWLLDLRSPTFPGPIDSQLVSKGKVIFKRVGCASCHDVSEGRIGKVTCIEELKTDPARHDLFTEEIVEKFEQVGSGYSWHFHHYRTTEGYVNMPLDGIWARGPYLHNGSVPSLLALLSRPEERPKRFLRGCTNIDATVVGFQCDNGFEFDTALKGNSNSGHDYGTALPASEKAALLEYLKSL